MSGCLGLLALLFAAGGGALWRLLWVKRARPVHDHLLRLLAGYVIGEDRSPGRAAQIEALLTVEFARDRRYRGLTAAVIAFAPREAAAFRDEVALVVIFQAFLKGHGVTVMERAPHQSGSWPPPPRR